MAIDASPVRCNVYNNLDKEQALDILLEVKENRNLLSNAPPVLPTEGEFYVFDLGCKANDAKKKFR